MTKTKWHSKLLSLSIAFALVFSLVAMVVPVNTTEASPDPTLSVSVSTENSTYCCCDNFNVTAVITETGSSENATDVNAKLTITGNAEIGLGTKIKTHTKSCGNITAGSAQNVTWEVHCTGKDTVVQTKFTVVVTSTNAATVSDYAEVLQESGWLEAVIITPVDDEIVSVCTEFDVTFYVKNTGCNSIRTIWARVEAITGTEIVGGAKYVDINIGRLDAYERSGNYTVRVHCTTVGPGIIHVDPIGKDVCSGAEIEGLSGVVEVQQVFGVTCNVTDTKVCHNATFSGEAGTDAVTPLTYNWTIWDAIHTAVKWINGTTAAGVYNFTDTLHFDTDGNYTACVNVTDSSNPPVTVQCSPCPVQFRVYPALNMTCDVSSNITKVGHCVNFTADRGGSGLAPGVLGANYTWSWVVTNATSGTVATNTSANWTWCPASAGNYTGTVTLEDGSSLNNTATCNVTVLVRPPLSVNCDVSQNETKIDHCVNFTAERVGGLEPGELGTNYKWTWSFTGGGTSTITSDNSSSLAVFCPTTTGNITGTVLLEDQSSLNNTATCNKTIYVYPALNVTCNATPNPSLVCHNVTFTAERDGGVPGHNYTWLWQFGDGYNSTAQNVTRAYMCTGNYTATVTLTDMDWGNTATCNVTLEVIIEPPELYTPQNMAQLTSKNVTFTWEDILCCTYTLEVWQKEADGQKVWLVETGKDAFWTGPVFNGNWRWRVTAMDSCNHTAESDTWFFQVDQPGPSVMVNSPNGGEVWAPGSAQTITWFATPTDGVIDLYLSSDGGASWGSIASGEDNDGAYPWTVPAISSEQCLVKVVITDAATGTAEDISDYLFTIGTPTTELAVEVDAPEQINEGQSYYVTAVISNVGTEAAANVTATLEINGEAILAAGTLAQTIGDIAVGGSQAVEWAVQCTGAGGVNLVVSADGNNTVAASGSAAVQQIAITAELAVEVDAPEQINEGQSYYVTAVISNVGTEDAANVTATLEINGEAILAAGTLAQTIGDIAVGGSQAVEWAVNCTGAGGVNLVVSADGNNTVPASGSAAVLQIADEIYPDVSVEYPNGGEALVAGTNVTITWSASDFWPMNGFGVSQSDDLDIDLYYSTDGGTTWETAIATDEENDGAYLWSIPSGIDSTSCLVKVDATDLAGNVGSDTSDSVFSIEMAVAPTTSIDLAAGWNLISLPLIPTNSTIESVMAGLNVTLIYYYDAAAVVPQWLFWNGTLASTLTDMVDGEGYWVYMGSAGTLTVVGTEMPVPPCPTCPPPPPPTYNVVAGWNMIGVKSTTPVAHGDYLMSVSGQYSVLYAYDAATGGWISVYPLEQNGGMMESGYGFWIWMNSAGTIVP